MTTISNRLIKSLDDYFALSDTVVYVYDLSHQAPRLINEAFERGIKVYSALAKRKTTKQKWIKIITYGVSTPTTVQIQFSSGCTLLDYSRFDSSDNIESEEERKPLVSILASLGNPSTGCKVISSLLRPGIAALPDNLYDVERNNYFRIKDAFRGGANNVRIYDRIPYETHVDYHQLYASVMVSHNFPWLKPQEANGYVPHEFGIYRLSGGRARLKKDGYALLPRLDFAGEGMAGADGEWFDLVRTLGCICDPDLKLLFENYEIEDLSICSTIYYPCSFSGKEEFSDIANKIYEGRKTSTGAVKRFYKLMNEYLAGYFERTLNKGSWWSSLDDPQNIIDKKVKRRNPIVGRFITAYGRQQLNALLHMFPHDKIAGYDTDCAFFCGKPEEVPAAVLQKFGDGVGQLHFDGIYKDVIHRASKSYYGWDLEKQAQFNKQSGYSKSGKTWCWDAVNHNYIIKEIKTNENI